MAFDPERHHRRSVRLREHDYAAGGTYFVTICTAGRVCLFGEVRDRGMRVNRIGLLVEREWVRTGEIRPEVAIDVFGMMPNHLHGLITITPVDDGGNVGGTGVLERRVAVGGRAHSGVPVQRESGGGPPVRRARSLSSIVGQFKASSTRVVNDALGIPGVRLWHRGFYEHVVRDDDDFARIAKYIVTNPERWETDEENPAR